jgi:hypothetical protein
MNHMRQIAILLTVLLIPLIVLSEVSPKNEQLPTNIHPFVPAPTLLPLIAVEPVEVKKDPLQTINAELYGILSCESGGGGKPKQFNSDGTVLRGRVNRSDVGAAQINEYYHLQASKRLGYDIYTLEGNIAYAKYLYDTQGTQPWSASKPCWGK